MNITINEKAKTVLIEKANEKIYEYLAELYSGLARMTEIDKVIATATPDEQFELFTEALSLTVRATELNDKIQEIVKQIENIEKM